MSTEAEGKAAYEAARKDLTNALLKRKEIDKQLVGFPGLFFVLLSDFFSATAGGSRVADIQL
jgi:hypothetical protein